MSEAGGHAGGEQVANLLTAPGVSSGDPAARADSGQLELSVTGEHALSPVLSTRSSTETSGNDRPQLQTHTSFAFISKWKQDADVGGADPRPVLKGVTMLLLAWKTLGVIYGDVGTSPLYVYSSTFFTPPKREDVEGAASIIFWLLTLSCCIKYLLIVLSADDNGEGGTFALYSLLRRNMQITAVGGSPHTGDLSLRQYSVRRRVANGLSHAEDARTRVGQAISDAFVRRRWLQYVLLLAVMIGTCLLMADVLGAMAGLKVGISNLSNDVVVAVTCIVLAVLFLVQRYGTDHIGASFAPIVFVWFVTNAVLGIRNITFSPHYAVKFFTRDFRFAWEAVGGLLLAITGTEAMFADLGHFNKKSIQLGFFFCAYPALVVTYFGQAAFLLERPEDVALVYWRALPSWWLWPQLVIATAASVVASQALITGAFSIIRQSMSLNCFPKLRVIHTSRKVEGQIYIPEVNYILLILTLAVVIGFRTTQKIGLAYGVAVVSVMTLTTCLITLVILVVWQKPWPLAAAFFLVFGTIDGFLLSTVLHKVPQGGWFTLAMAGAFFVPMFVWYYGSSLKQQYDIDGKKTVEALLMQCNCPAQVIASPRVPEQALETHLIMRDNARHVSRYNGVGLFYSEMISGAPPVFVHYLQNIPALPEVVIFFTKRDVAVPTVDADERFLVKQLAFTNFFHVIARFGYNDTADLDDGFVRALQRCIELEIGDHVAGVVEDWSQNVTHVVARSVIHAKGQRKLLRYVILEILHGFLRRNTRTVAQAFNIPEDKLVEVATMYFL
eukprot:jgi/Chlat1/4551/Chrsp29S00337